MRAYIIMALLVLGVVVCDLPGNKNTFSFTNNWQVSYSIYNSYLYVSATGTNNGAVGIGFGGTKMAGIDIAHGYVDANNVVQVADRSYIQPDPAATKHIVDLDTTRNPVGTSDYENNGSTYDDKTNTWVFSFKRKLDTGDQYDNVITDGSATQIAIALFDGFVWGAKHTSALYQTVTLSSASSQTSSSILVASVALIASIISLF